MIAKGVFFLVKNYQFYHRDSLFLRVDQLTILLIEWGRNWGITVRRRRGEGMVFSLWLLVPMYLITVLKVRARPVRRRPSHERYS